MDKILETYLQLGASCDTNDISYRDNGYHDCEYGYEETYSEYHDRFGGTRDTE